MLRTGPGLGTIAAFLATATLPAGTITTSQPLTLTETWNAAGVTFTAFKVNVTDTASATASLLADFQVGGSSKVSIRKDGALALFGNASPSFDNLGGYFSILALNGGGNIAFGPYGAGIGTTYEVIKSTGHIVGASRLFGWSSTDDPTTTVDLSLFRDAANTYAQRNGANAQTARFYSTWTDASNGEWLEITKTGSGFEVRAKQNGTGSSQPLVLSGGSSSNLQFGTGGTVRWKIDSSGNLIAQDGADASYDFGQPGANRVRDVWIGRTLAVAGQTALGGASVSASTALALPAGSTGISPLRFIQGVAPTAPADGDMWREDNTNTGLKVRINGVTKTVTVS